MKLDKKLNIKMNKELKEYLYMLVGKELTYEDKEKILSYFNDLKQQNDRMKRKAAIAMTMLSWRIDQAIKMIYKMTENELNYIHWKGKEVLVCGSDFEGAEILLDILKGSDSNE